MRRHLSSSTEILLSLNLFCWFRIRQFSKDLYDLGLKFGCEYFTFAVVDAICRSPEILEDESLLSQMNIDMFQDVFSNDNLLVSIRNMS